MAKPRGYYHQWTKEDIKAVLRMWKTKTASQIAQELHVTVAQINYIAFQVRKVDKAILPKKYREGYSQSLIKDAIAELQ